MSLPPITLYARLAGASARLSRLLSYLGGDHPLSQALDAAWVHLDDLIEQLPAALAWDAERQIKEDMP
jgi:hypothetical protein